MVVVVIIGILGALVVPKLLGRTGEARVTAAKSQWWAEELLLVARGAGRHPVCADLPPALPWAALARAVLEQASFDGRPTDAAHALEQVAPLAEAIAAIEAGLHEAPPPVRAVAVNLLLHRLPHGLVAEDQARLPLGLLARHGLTVAQVAEGQGEALLRDWARELLAALPAPVRPSSLYRRLRSGFDRARLQRLAAGRGFDPPPAPASVWRASRHGATLAFDPTNLSMVCCASTNRRCSATMARRSRPNTTERAPPRPACCGKAIADAKQARGEG